MDKIDVMIKVIREFMILIVGKKLEIILVIIILVMVLISLLGILNIKFEIFCFDFVFILDLICFIILLFIFDINGLMVLSNVLCINCFLSFFMVNIE